MNLAQRVFKRGKAVCENIFEQQSIINSCQKYISLGQPNVDNHSMEMYFQGSEDQREFLIG